LTRSSRNSLPITGTRRRLSPPSTSIRRIHNRKPNVYSKSKVEV
jgi:hypothetical protein